MKWLMVDLAPQTGWLCLYIETHSLIILHDSSDSTVHFKMWILSIHTSYLHIACSVVVLRVGVTAAVPPQRRWQQVGVIRRRGLGAARRLSIGRVLGWALWTEESRHGGGAAWGRSCVHTMWPTGAPHGGDGGVAVSHFLHAAASRTLELFGRGQGAAGGQGHGLLFDSHPKEVLAHHGWSLLVVHGRVRWRRDGVLCCTVAAFPLVQLHLQLFNLTHMVTVVNISLCQCSIILFYNKNFYNNNIIWCHCSFIVSAANRVLLYILKSLCLNSSPCTGSISTWNNNVQ